MAFHVWVKPKNGRAVRVEVRPIRSPELARRVAELVRRFLRADARHAVGPEWAFGLRRELGALAKGARVRVRRAE